MPHRGEGPIPARVMAVGECWGQSEDEQGIPFVGYSGSELNKMLHEANLMRSEIFVSNVINHRPPDNDLKHWIAFAKNQITPEHRPWRGWMVKPIVEEGHRQLLAEIEMVKPNVIVAFGNLALHALHQGHIVMKPQGPSGIRKWRGSLLKSDQGVKLIPSVHPAAVLRQWDWRPAAVNDLRRVKQHSGPEDYNFPKYNFRIRPSFGQATSILTELIRRLDAGEVIWLDTDFETGRRHRHIKCFGFSWSRTEALCLPFLALGHPGGYWSEDEETHVIYLLWKLLTHRNVRVRWQNGLFDVQHAYRYWHFIPRCDQDTMISQHSIFSDQPKTLAYQASIYSDDYVYWKEEGKTEIDMARTTKEEEEGWVYNCKDCTYTRQVGEAELAMIDGFAIVPHTHPRYWPHAKKVHDFQQAMFWPVLAAMNLGLKIREDVSKQLADEIQQQIHMREDFFKQVIGRDVNFGSSKQLQELFYDELGQQAIWTRAKKGTPAHITCDDEALLKIGTREPLLKPITQCIADVRTLEKFKSDFILAKRDVDGRMRCSFNIGGSESGKSAPKTYRLSSSKNAFGSGANLQTIPSEKSKSVGKWDARAKSHMALIGDPYSLPNLRSMYAPDPGHDQFDEDLDRADLQVMAWDADEPLLKEALKRKVDLHLLNVYVLDAKDPPPLEELVETHPKYPDHRGPRKTKREFAKIFCHACLTGGHEVLTKQGWVPIEHLSDTTEIAVWDKDTKNLYFEVPSHMHRDFAQKGETLVSFSGQAYSQEVTADHTIPYTTDETIQSCQAIHVPESARLPVAGWYSGTRSVDESLIRLLAAFQADGFFDYKYRTGWHLKKERKIERLLWLAKEAGLVPTIQVASTTRIFLYWRPVDWMKVPGAWLLELDGEALDWWLDELKYWDAYQGETGSITVSTSRPETAEWIQTIAHLRGKGSRRRIHEVAKENRKDSWNVTLNNRVYASVASMRVTRTELNVAVPVYCPSTSTGFFLVRRDGHISITGNTDYLGKARTVAAHTGRTVHETERAQNIYLSTYKGIAKWQQSIITQVTKHRFVENRFGYRWYIFDRIDDQVMPEAVAWIPQSTVSIVINRIWMNIYQGCLEDKWNLSTEHIMWLLHNPPDGIKVQLQVHDSLVGQYPSHMRDRCVMRLKELAHVVVPYDDPLVIPTGISTSSVSWGDC